MKLYEETLFAEQYNDGLSGQLSLDQKINDRQCQSWHWLIIKAAHENLNQSDIKLLSRKEIIELKASLLKNYEETCGLE